MEKDKNIQYYKNKLNELENLHKSQAKPYIENYQKIESYQPNVNMQIGKLITKNNIYYK